MQKPTEKPLKIQLILIKSFSLFYFIYLLGMRMISGTLSGKKSALKGTALSPFQVYNLFCLIQ